MAGLPAMTPEGLLPPGRHPATIADIRDRFVINAPYRAERAVVFAAFEVYAQRVWSLFPDARLWVNGGFVTHKSWAAPADMDIAVLIAMSALNARSEDSLPLWTLQGVSAGTPRLVGVPRIQPMGGLIDGFAVPADVPPVVAYWDDWWGRVTDENKMHVPGVVKGFVEVVKP